MKNLYVLGNGESRKDIDVNELKKTGKVWGCNAIYRDYDLDGLIAVDPMLEHEIYRSGYAHKNKCYFRSWDNMPVEHFDMMKEAQTSNMKNPTIREWKANPEGHYLSFVIHGQGAVDKDRQTDRWKGDGFDNVYITWTYGHDKIELLRNVMDDYNVGWEGDEGPRDPGWSAGATAMYIACKEEKPDKCYLLGMDMYSSTDFINNLYKSTYGYLNDTEGSVTPQNWVIQMGRCMVRFKDIEFIKVNPEGNSTISQRMPQWDSLPNVSYMHTKEFSDNIW